MCNIGAGDKGLRIRIRQVAPEDWNEVIRIGRESFDYIANPGEFFLERMLKYYFFVAEANGEVVGFIDMEALPDGAAAITGLAVKKAWRGKGIGKTLAEFGVRFLQALGFKKIHIMTLKHNEPALRIYKSLGFSETGTKGDVVFLEKDLPPNGNNK